MDGEEGGGLRLSKRFSDRNEAGEVDYKTKAGTAWSHSFLNQKPWHPLSYPNQRRKWIAEQTDAQRHRRAEEVAREYAQEQDFFRQTALISNKEKEKIETMKAVSFMYVRPPGYNAESAKAAEIADERKNSGHDSGPPTSETLPVREEKKKPRPKDVFGRALPTEEEFEVLKNAPRLETGLPARPKPFAVEVRNVKCLRCGTYGHQSGDRECPLKDAIMPNEETRLKRDDPLTAILAQTDPTEPLKWELKQKPGLSPPRGGFDPDDPNQQIVAEDIFDEYGGFFNEGSIPDFLGNCTTNKPKKKSRRKTSEDGSRSHSEKERRLKKRDEKHKRRKKDHSKSSSSHRSESRSSRRNVRPAHSSSTESSDSDRDNRHKHCHRDRHRHKHRRIDMVAQQRFPRS